MKLIRKMIEDAAGGAVGGGDVAAAATPLFAGLSKRNLPIKLKVTKKPKVAKAVRVGKSIGIGEAFHHLSEGDDPHRRGSDTFDATAVISKLKSIENKNSADMRDAQAFVLEDDDGHAVKIWIRGDQASSFEAALNAILSDNDENDRQTIPEIAEILYKLKDNFDIIDIAWPEIQEDEEEDQSLAQGGDAEGMGDEAGLGGEPGAEGEAGLGGEEDLTGIGAETGAGQEDVKGLLAQIIDMMKADADARKAEARAKEAEAKAKETNIAKDQVMARVKQEEQILDMEAHEKKQKDADKEAKRLAKLARWQHEMGVEDQSAPMSNQGGMEDEEARSKPSRRVSSRVSPHEVAKFILNRTK